MAKKKSDPLYRLTPSVIGELTGRDLWPKVDFFAAKYRGRGMVGQVERLWPKLTSGVGVPEPVVRGFFDCLAIDKKLTGFSFDAHAEPAPPPVPPEAEGAWAAWQTAVFKLLPPLVDNDLMYLDDPDKDIAVIAASFYKYLGWTSDPRATEAEALRRGEHVRGLSVADEARWLRAMYVPPYRSILYAVRNGVRVGAMITIPVPEPVYKKIAGGGMRPEEITPAQLPAGSAARHLWIETLTPVGEGFQMGVVGRSAAETRLFLYQVAYHSRSLSGRDPVLFGVYTDDYFRQRFDRFGFRPSGASMKGTAYPIVVLEPPASILTLTGFPYGTMQVGVAATQALNAEVWQREDATPYRED